MGGGGGGLFERSQSENGGGGGGLCGWMAVDECVSVWGAPLQLPTTLASDPTTRETGRVAGEQGWVLSGRHPLMSKRGSNISQRL